MADSIVDSKLAEFLLGMTGDDLEKTHHELLEQDERDLLATSFPDTGPFRRELYPKHMSFFRAGKKYRERLFMAANRVGKTRCGGQEVACHATGLYPPWWEGRTFSRPPKIWVSGKTNEQTRDVVQTVLFGEVMEGPPKWFDGRGMVPLHLVDPGVTWKRSVQNLADVVRVRHASGGFSRIGFKSYEQGRGSFEGTAQHVIWFDEEPPADVYGEALIRTATTNGIVLVTFTPLEGMSEVVRSFMLSEDMTGA